MGQEEGAGGAKDGWVALEGLEKVVGVGRVRMWDLEWCELLGDEVIFEGFGGFRRYSYFETLG